MFRIRSFRTFAPTSFSISSNRTKLFRLISLQFIFFIDDTVWRSGEDIGNVQVNYFWRSHFACHFLLLHSKNSLFFLGSSDQHPFQRKFPFQLMKLSYGISCLSFSFLEFKLFVHYYKCFSHSVLCTSELFLTKSLCLSLLD